jgi:hypothetical protein
MGCVYGNTSSINDEEKEQSIRTCSSEETTAVKRLSMKNKFNEGENIAKKNETSSVSSFIVSAILEASDYIDLGINKNDHLIS